MRHPDDSISERLADELDELAGAIDGTHRHVDRRSDITLEAGQVLYWVLLRCVRSRIGWDTLRPDRAVDIAATDDGMSTGLLSKLLRETAQEWRGHGDRTSERIASDAHATINLVAQACIANGIPPREIVERDLAELQTRPYLEPYFAAGASG